MKTAGSEKASESRWERGGSGKTQTLLIFSRSPATRRTDPLTEGLEQATGIPDHKGTCLYYTSYKMFWKRMGFSGILTIKQCT